MVCTAGAQQVRTGFDHLSNAIDAVNATGRFDGAAFAAEPRQLLHLLRVTGRAEAIAGLNARSANIDGCFHREGELILR